MKQVAERVAEMLNPLAIRILQYLKKKGIGTYVHDAKLATGIRHHYDGYFCSALGGLSRLELIKIRDGHEIAGTEKGSETLEWYEKQAKNLSKASRHTQG